MNLEQGIIKIKHINRIHATNNHNILTTNGKEKKKTDGRMKLDISCMSMLFNIRIF